MPSGCLISISLFRLHYTAASILCDKLGLKNAFAFDLQAACSGFLFLMETAANFIRSGRYKKIIIVEGK